MTASSSPGGWSGLYDTFTELVRFQTELWAEVDAAVRGAHGVPLTHVTVLELVATTDGCRVSDLVDTLHITVGGASKSVDRLVAGGWAVRATNPRDGRSSILATTPAGDAVLRDAGPTIDAVLRARLRDPLDPDTLRALHHTLSVLRTAGPATPDRGDDR